MWRSGSFSERMSLKLKVWGKLLQRQSLKLKEKIAYFLEENISVSLKMFIHNQNTSISLQHISPTGRSMITIDLQNFFIFFKGNQNFQGILNWILQILHYYCRKQHKNIKNSQINEQNVVMCLCPSVYCDLCSLLLSQRQSFFCS